MVNLGCFKDSSNRDLEKKVEAEKRDVDSCITACHDLNYIFAGV